MFWCLASGHALGCSRAPLVLGKDFVGARFRVLASPAWLFHVFVGHALGCSWGFSSLPQQLICSLYRNPLLAEGVSEAPHSGRSHFRGSVSLALLSQCITFANISEIDKARSLHLRLWLRSSNAPSVLRAPQARRGLTPHLMARGGCSAFKFRV